MSSPDPNSWIQGALDDLRYVLAGKNEDYRIDGEFSNFEFAAEVAGIETHRSILNQLAIKIGRLKGIEGKDVSNETSFDTYRDLAGYAVILYAYAMSVEYGDRHEGPRWTERQTKEEDRTNLLEGYDPNDDTDS